MERAVGDRPGPGGQRKATGTATAPAPAAPDAAAITDLQRTAGNRQVAKLLSVRSPAVQRWDGPEHVRLGETAKGPQSGLLLLDSHARDLPNRTAGVAKWPAEWQALHRKGSKEQQRALKDGLTYGEMVALSGDMYQDFDALNRAPLREIYDLIPLVRRSGSTEELEAATGGRYLTLAKENESHFSNVRPGHANIEVWWQRHASAIMAARQGNTNRAWAMNAAADHYLTDAFSGGHIRTPRAKLHAEGTKGDLKSKVLHDLDNENGVEVTNARGDKPWIAYGDNLLTDPRNTRNRALAEEAVALSKQDIADALAARNSYPIPQAGTRFAAERLVPHPTDPSRNRWGNTDLAKELGSLAKGELPGQITAIWEDDNRVRDWIGRQDPTAIGRQSVADRVRMINVLLDGPTLDDDEDMILRVLAGSVSAGDQVKVIDAVGAHKLMDNLDGAEATRLRTVLRTSYYRQTDQATAFDLIVACIDGVTHEWEESMIVDLLELQPDGRGLVRMVGRKYGGSATGADRDFRNGMHELSDQLDGSDDSKLHSLFPGG